MSSHTPDKVRFGRLGYFWSFEGLSALSSTHTQPLVTLGFRSLGYFQALRVRTRVLVVRVLKLFLEVVGSIPMLGI